MFFERENIPHPHICVIRSIYERSNFNFIYVTTRDEKSKIANTKTGLKQGCDLVSLFLNFILDEAVKECRNNMNQYCARH